MKKNYIAVIQKAENSISKLGLIFLLICIFTLQVRAQLFTNTGNKNGNIARSIKGPSGATGEREGLDATPPTIVYTALTNTCATGNRVLTATITDVADGVPTSGAGLPVLYWKINSGIYNAVTGVSIGAGQYNFTFGLGATAGNLVSYYIVAQDNAGNVIAKPSAGAAGYTISPPAVSTDPTSPDFYVIQTTLAAGVYNVGAAQTYLTITDAVNAYNNSCLSGAVTFLLTDPLYSTSEVFPITISNTQASASNTLLIKPAAGVNPTIQGSAADAIFKFNGADYVTIDGSNSAAATRNLTIQNSSTGLSSTVIWVGSTSASNGANNNSIKNTTISGNAANTTFAGIISSSGITVGATAETANANNSYTNNSINTCYYGLAVTGPVTGESGTVISNNIVGSTSAAKKLGYRGVLINNQTNVQVNNNTIAGVISPLGLGSDTDPAGGIIVSGVISGGNIYSNSIDDIRNTSVAGWQAYGISLQSTSTNAGIKIYNNFIYNVIANGNVTTPANNGIGIAVQSGGGYGIFYNSVHLTGAIAGISSCIFIGAGVTGTASLDIRNNIFSNRRTSGTNYAIYSSVPNIVFSNINYNDYYGITFLGFLGGNRANIAAWQTATGLDGNSVATNPIFVSNSDLHLQPISPLNDQGIPIPGITTDIDGITRSVTATDIGADEFTPPNCSGNSGGTAVSDFITVCTSGSVSLSATGFSFGLGISYIWQRSTDGVSFTDIAGETNPTSANPPVIVVTTWYRLKVTCSLTGGSPGYSNAVIITVYNPTIATTTPGSRCGPGTVSLSATGSPTTAIQWYDSANGGAPVFTGNPFVTPSISATTTYYVESTYLGSSGTVGPVSPTAAGGTISTQLTSWDVTFNVIQATKLLTIDIFPLTAGEFSIIDVYNSAGTVIASVPYTTTASGGNTAQTVTMNVSLPIGNGYYLYATNGLPTSGLKRNISGASYPYNSSDIVITGNGFDATFFMCYYRWRFSNGCSSNPRTAVTATIGVSAALNVTATPPSICDGSSSVLNVTSSNAGYNYVWQPGTLSGASQTVSPTSNTTYTVTATDGTCTATNTITITVNPSSSDVVITPSTVTKCFTDAAQLLTATGGDITGIPILEQNFNAVGTPPGWVIANTSTGTAGQIAASNWTLRPDAYVFAGTTFRSNDFTQFYLSNSDANPALTRTTLRTPAFSLVGYTSAEISFWHYFAVFGFPDSIAVEISQNLTAWSTVYSNKVGRGGSTSFGNNIVSLNPWLGQATNYIRFRYTGNDGFQWALDNVSITGSNSGAPITWAPAAGLFTDAAATVPYSGAAATSVYAKPASTTTYTATATPVNACQKSKTIDVTVRNVGGVISGSTAVCPSGSATISIALTGTGPWNLTYTDGTTPVTVNNVAASPYTFIVNPLVTTTYTLTNVADAFCTAIPANLTGSAVITVSATLFSTWVGITNVWTDPANWCGGVPTASKDVVIPSSPNYPVITVSGLARDISISSGASITIDPGATFSFRGNFVNNGDIINNGRILINGTSVQTFPGGTTGTITAMNNLEFDNTAGVTLNNPVFITGTLIPTAGTLTLNNCVLTLRSTVAATARVSALGVSAGFAYTGTGKFSVERYISSATRTGWRFLAAPIGGTETINQAWQEGQASGNYSSTGYGMQIVGPLAAGTGFDMNINIPSLKLYNQLTNAWNSVPGTNGPISRPDGYMAFVRGDRGSNTFGSTSPTTLRMSGPIKTGSIGPISTATANGFISVGNPYPSAINFTATVRNGLQDVYFLWDPKLGTYGGYQTFSGPGYTATPGGGSYSGGNKFIESGQAFFVVANSSAVPHNISFAESNKVVGSFQVQRTVTTGKQLRTQFYSVSTTGTNLTDGTLIEFDATYNNTVDDLDAPKLSNFGENFGIINSGKSISVERRAEIVETDTLYFQLGQLRQQEYQLEFIAQELAVPGLTAFLEDRFLNSSSIILLEGTTVVNFTVTADPASKAQDRFRIVFKQLGPVPVTFTSITAVPVNKDVLVSWKVENELNIERYEIERSADGRSFVKLGAQLASGNNGGGSLSYSFTDVAPLSGVNFYRIKSVGIGADIKYSEVVSVNIASAPQQIVVYPNPVKDGIITLSFIKEPKAIYQVKLVTGTGQIVLTRQINHPGGSQKVTIDIGQHLAKGFYAIEVYQQKMKKRVFKLLVE